MSPNVEKLPVPIIRFNIFMFSTIYSDFRAAYHLEGLEVKDILETECVQRSQRSRSAFISRYGQLYEPISKRKYLPTAHLGR